MIVTMTTTVIMTATKTATKSIQSNSTVKAGRPDQFGETGPSSPALPRDSTQSGVIANPLPTITSLARGAEAAPGVSTPCPCVT